MVERSFGLTVSAAERMGTRFDAHGVGELNDVLNDVAFGPGPDRHSAASEINSGRAYVGTSMTNTWLMHRSLAKPVSYGTLVLAVGTRAVRTGHPLSALRQRW